MSPRTSSVSDRSRKSVSPRHTQSILPNVSSEAGHQACLLSTLAQPDKGNGQDLHASKVARTDTAASHSYGGGTSDIPPKIEEGTEPV